MKKLIVVLSMFGCSQTIEGDGETTSIGGEGGETSTPKVRPPKGGEGGSKEDSSGGESTGGSTPKEVPPKGETGGEGPTGGEGTGGDPSPPFTPSCSNFRCGSYTPTGVSSEVYCFDVLPNNSQKGNFEEVEGDCIVTHNGEKFPSFANGVPEGELILWGCDFWFNCY